jgi:hypothetical protein
MLDQAGAFFDVGLTSPPTDFYLCGFNSEKKRFTEGLGLSNPSMRASVVKLLFASYICCPLLSLCLIKPGLSWSRANIASNDLLSVLALMCQAPDAVFALGQL